MLVDSRSAPPSALFLSTLKLFQVRPRNQLRSRTRLAPAALIPPVPRACFQVLLPGGLGSVLVLVEEQQESPSCVVEGVEVTFGLF